jgi:hypothetical protein
MATIDFLDRYLEPMTTVFTPQLAKKIVELRPEADVIAHVEELGIKSDNGSLTDEEREEYRSLANAGTLISLLKAKARRFLSQHDS